ncbi:MAG: T9SS type A sorting domain-containing protein [Prevotella sp.]|nr:T9SS type A sorting domain-containing protein [Prevotella sp.]
MADAYTHWGWIANPAQRVRYTFQIPVSDFSTGTYFLSISSGNQTKTEMIIIKK